MFSLSLCVSVSHSVCIYSEVPIYVSSRMTGDFDLGCEYSVTTCRMLEKAFDALGVLRPMSMERYDAGRKLIYEVTGVAPSAGATVHLEVEKFVGGGFAGQVYRVKVASIEGQPIAGLDVGGYYAMKILIPPSNFSHKFRDAIYKAGFQGDFSLQVNPSAARAGAIWQKLIRRGAKIRFGTEKSVVDVLGTFFDEAMGSCGEISEWIDGRNWLFEVDDHLSQRKRGLKRADAGPENTGSPEYLAKRRFMAGMVELLHEMGGPELARQYEWWTAKSQPNVLKRLEADGDADPSAGLTAVDFRAGLALLPVLPMSPADVKLIFAGLSRGSVVQFDRGSLRKLRRFVDANSEEFADMRPALAELEDCEEVYRNSLPDVTHHHVRLFYDGQLWKGILDGAVTAWRAKGMIDSQAANRLGQSRFLTILFAVFGLLPMFSFAAGAALFIWAWSAGSLGWGTLVISACLAIPTPMILGFLRRLLGRGDLRMHYAKIFTDRSYLRRAYLAHVSETLIAWHRGNRVSSEQAGRLLTKPALFAAHTVLFSWLPASLHRILTNRQYAAERLRYIFVRPVKLYFNADDREQWLRDMVAEGRKKHMLTGEDAEHILSRIKEPFIQKYLKSLAVHLCTLPVTQVVSVAVALWYKIANSLTWGQAWDEMLLIIGVFQVIPISPGSLARGFYVLYLVIRERNVRDYNIAVFLSFFKYVGYLAFPIQMAYRYPVLARFMAAHWATEAVHVVPVFGERGALLEHGVFDLFYNFPLTIRRQMGRRAELRKVLKTRMWHIIPAAAVGVAMFALADAICRTHWGTLPTLKNVWPATILIPAIIGSAATLLAGGAKMLDAGQVGDGCNRPDGFGIYRRSCNDDLHSGDGGRYIPDVRSGRPPCQRCPLEPVYLHADWNSRSPAD